MNVPAIAIAALLLVFTAVGGGRAAAAAPPERFGALELYEQAAEGRAGNRAGRRDGARLHLGWRSADGRLTLDLTDDGEAMRADVGVRFCRVIVQYMRYRNRPGEPRLRRSLRDAVGGLLDRCEAVPAPERAPWLAEYDRAEADFPAAIEAMKRRALRLFGGDLKRCRRARARGRELSRMLACERTD